MVEPGAKKWSIEGLSSQHDRPSFCCGNDALDAFLRTEANQAQRKDLSRTFVLTDLPTAPAKVPILGFYTLAICEIELDIIPYEFAKGLPRYPIPAVHIARLAVARHLQGQGLGSLLLADAIKRAVQTSDNVGINLIDVIAKGDQTRRWYEARGFTPVPDEPDHLIMSMKAARKAIKLATRKAGEPDGD